MCPDVDSMNLIPGNGKIISIWISPKTFWWSTGTRKRYSFSIIIREFPIKATVKYHLAHIRTAGTLEASIDWI